MKKAFGTFLIALMLIQAQAQVVVDKSGELSFFSSTPVEDISAKSKTAQSALNLSSKEIAVKAIIKDFTFPKSLMQEHFNENYLESEKYPNATFKGKINEAIDFSKSGTYNVTATGKLSIHGVEKDKTIDGVFKVDGNKISLDASFEVLLEDYKIERPQLVMMKIAEKIAVKGKFAFVSK